MTPDDERQALLRAVADDPEDTAVRLVYADWLEEHGREDLDAFRAAFIRAQVECDTCERDCRGGGGHQCSPAAPCPGCAHYDRLRLRVWRLFAQFLGGTGLVEAEPFFHGLDVIHGLPVPSAAVACRYGRGFIETVCSPLDLWMAYGHVLVRHHPLRRVTLSDRVPVAGRAGWYWLFGTGSDRVPLELQLRWGRLHLTEPAGGSDSNRFSSRELAEAALSVALLARARRQSEVTARDRA